MYIGKIRSPLTVILLSIVTCGIYMFFWYYVTMESINNLYDERPISSGMLLFFSIICPPVIFYLYYLFDKHLKEISNREDITYEGSMILWLLLTLVAGVGGIVMIWQTQSTLNQLWAKRSAWS
jgi:Na+-driven multidrug efflux pump